LEDGIGEGLKIRGEDARFDKTAEEREERWEDVKEVDAGAFEGEATETMRMLERLEDEVDATGQRVDEAEVGDVRTARSEPLDAGTASKAVHAEGVDVREGRGEGIRPWQFRWREA
jgi:hypothetical protein